MSRVRGLAVGAVAAMLATFSPTAGGTAPAQQDALASPAQGVDAGPAIHIDVDIVNSDPDDIAEAFEDLLTHVGDQVDQLREAEEALEEAEGAVRDARGAVVETEGRITELTALRDEVVVGAFMNPPSVGGLDDLLTDTPSDLAMRQALLGIRADDEAGILQGLDEAQDELDTRKAREETLARDAQDARDNAAARLGDLESAVNRQTLFFASVEQRLEHGASEALALAELDPELAAELDADRDALAEMFQEMIDAREWAEAVDALAEAMRKAEEERAAEEARRQREAEAAAATAAAEPAAAAPSADIGPASGGLSTVSCPGGGSITVDSSLATNLSNLLTAAASDGVMLCGGGWRDPQRQIELRRAHCGPSDYAVYEMPASQCSPPTARPGTSQHEVGLAVDFTCSGGGAISSRSSPCFVWLQSNAASYGLYNLPSEPWHWSTTGR